MHSDGRIAAVFSVILLAIVAGASVAADAPTSAASVRDAASAPASAGTAADAATVAWVDRLDVEVQRRLREVDGRFGLARLRDVIIANHMKLGGLARFGAENAEEAAIVAALEQRELALIVDLAGAEALAPQRLVIGSAPIVVAGRVDEAAVPDSEARAAVARELLLAVAASGKGERRELGGWRFEARPIPMRRACRDCHDAPRGALARHGLIGISIFGLR